MGHQLNFYGYPTDIRDLEARFRAAAPDLRVLHSRSSSEAPRVVPTMLLEEGGAPWPHLHLVRESDLGAVVMSHVSAEGHWTVDAARSPVIEFTRGHFDHSILRRSRLHFDDGIQGDDGKRTPKPLAFKEWADPLLRKAKKMMIRQGAEYVGPHAQSWLEQWHGQLVD